MYTYIYRRVLEGEGNNNNNKEKKKLLSLEDDI